MWFHQLVAFKDENGQMSTHRLAQKAAVGMERAFSLPNLSIDTWEKMVDKTWPEKSIIHLHHFIVKPKWERHSGVQSEAPPNREGVHTASVLRSAGVSFFVSGLHQATLIYVLQRRSVLETQVRQRHGGKPALLGVQPRFPGRLVILFPGGIFQAGFVNLLHQLTPKMGAEIKKKKSQSKLSNARKGLFVWICHHLLRYSMIPLWKFIWGTWCSKVQGKLRQRTSTWEI